MLIRIDGQIIDNRFAHVADDAPLGDGPIIVSLARTLSDLDGLVVRPAPFGVMLPNTVTVEEISSVLNEASLLAINFPAFSDGRGFSLARRLRLAGFTGLLRAVGPLIPDQVRHARAVGFNEILLPDAVAERQSVEDWRVAASIISHVYQDGYRGETVLERRRHARGGANP